MEGKKKKTSSADFWSSELVSVFCNLFSQSLRNPRRAEAADRRGPLHGHRGAAGRGAQPRLQEHGGRPEPLRRLRLVLLPLSSARRALLVGQPPLQLLQVRGRAGLLGHRGGNDHLGAGRTLNQDISRVL